MNKKSLYDIFMGLLALMLSIMLILDIVVKLPKNVLLTFHYVDLIVVGIFLLDYFIRFIASKEKKYFVYKNKIDFLALIPMRLYFEILSFFITVDKDNIVMIITLLKIVRLTILLTKFKDKIKEQVRLNKFNYVLILTTMIIVIGALMISLLEEMSFGDALWWSFVTFTTVGYGDVMLKTVMGRFVAVILMVFGIGVIGITTSTVAAYIINGKPNKNKSKNIKEGTIDYIKYRIDNVDKLSDKDIEDIYKILKTLRDQK